MEEKGCVLVFQNGSHGICCHLQNDLLVEFKEYVIQTYGKYEASREERSMFGENITYFTLHFNIIPSVDQSNFVEKFVSGWLDQTR